MNAEERTDEALTDAARLGEQEAFAELYDRYFPKVYDFAIRLTRARDTAAAVTQAAFYMALQWIRSGDPGAPFNIQIFALAHHDLTQRARQAQNQVFEGDEAFVGIEPSPEDSAALAADLPELARISWQSARELRPEEYELLDLHTRREMSVTDIGSVTRTKGDTVVNRLGRIRQMFEEAFSVLVLVHRGRRECLDLDFLVGEQAASSSERRRIGSHLASCDVCKATRGRYPSGGDILRRLTLVPAPEGWQDVIIGRLLDTTPGSAVPAAAAGAAAVAPPPDAAWVGSGGGGFGAWWDNVWHGNGKWWLLGLAGAVLLLGVILGSTLCAADAFEDDPPGPTGTPTASPTATPSATTTPTDTPTVTETPFPTDTPEPPPTLPPPTNTPVPPPPTNTPVPPTAITP
jgi:DNA-directed RNA polymerase specialized sigma24 family protein